MATLLTHSTTACAENYSLFGKDKSFYGLPAVVKSHTSIQSDVGSLLAKTRSFGELGHEVSIVTTRSTGPLAPIEITQRPATHHGEPLQAPILTLEGEEIEPDDLEEYEDETPTGASSPDSPRPDTASYYTAESLGFSDRLPKPTTREVIIHNPPKSPYVFQKWMKVFKKPARISRREHLGDEFEYTRDGSIITADTTDSSNEYVTEVKTASITLASFGTSINTSGHRGSNWSALDKETVERMLDRKHALEELISTEEYYIKDLKSLKDQYLPILRDCVWISADVRQVMVRNVTEMVDLHGRLLAEIQRVLPCTTQMMQGHKLAGRPRAGVLDRHPVLADPAAAAEVAKAFESIIMGFFVYEEYSARYQEVLRAPKRSGKAAEFAQGKGAEALIGASNSWDNRGDYGKRAMELQDMLSKPIQRLCKYPLLFREIEKHTPAIDCPDTNRLLERVRLCLDEQVHQVNNASNETPQARERMEKTWRLQDRLDFHKAGLPVRLLGHIILCGTLHVTWQSKKDSQPRTEYMACLLFKSYLILASVQKPDQYKVRFAITLGVARTGEPNHGKGLYSPGAPHTWKVLFESNRRIYEVLLSACNDEEEDIWRTHIQNRIEAESADYQEYRSTNVDFCSCISSDIKPVGDALGRPGSLVRHQSLHIGGSGSLMSDGQYVLINNMLSHNDPSGVESPKKGYSTLNFGGLVPTINLKRTDRNRVEARLADVWTKDVLPFGLTRVKPPKENNPGVMMRRISVLNMLTGTPKKSHSQGSLSDYFESALIAEEENNWAKAVRRSSTKSSGKTATNSTSSSGKSTPDGATKRSSSLSSRFSFGSSGKKENSQEKAATIMNPIRRKSLRPMLDVNKWRASTFPLTRSSTLMKDPTTAAGGSKDRWSEGDKFLFRTSTAVPLPERTLEEEPIDYLADFSRPATAIEEGVDKMTPSQWRAKYQHSVIRRHTVMSPPPMAPNRRLSKKAEKMLGIA